MSSPNVVYPLVVLSMKTTAFETKEQRTLYQRKKRKRQWEWILRMGLLTIAII